MDRLYLYSKGAYALRFALYASKSNHCAYSCGGSLELFKTKGKALLFHFYLLYMLFD